MKSTLKPTNYTPHDVIIRLGGGKEIAYPSVGLCRAEAREQCAFSWDPDTCTEWHVHAWGQADNERLVVMEKPTYGGCSWTPGPPVDGADVIVSVVAAPAVVETRPDLRVFVPDTGPSSAIRTGKGQIEAIRRLVLWHDPLAKTHLLRVISLASPSGFGDGLRLHSRHLPTRDGIVEALHENPFGRLNYTGYLELADERGQARQSAHTILSNDVDALWGWLQDEIDRAE